MSETTPTGPDSFPLPADHPLQGEHLRVSAYLQDAVAQGVGLFDFKAQAVTSGRELLAAPKREQCTVAVATAERLARLGRGRSRRIDATWTALQGLLRALLARTLPFTTDELVGLSGMVAQADLVPWVPVKALLRQVSCCLEREPLPPELERSLAALRKVLERYSHQKAQREEAALLDELVRKARRP